MHWNDVTERVTDDARGKWDQTLCPEELELHEGRLRIVSRPFLLSEAELVMTPWATSQFCQRLSIPAGYFRRCPKALQDAQANHWLRAQGETKDSECGKDWERNGEQKDRDKQSRWMLRAKGHTLRGIVSERYAPFDHTELLQAVSPVLEERFQVNWFSLTEDSLHLRLVDPRLSREALPGDRLLAGIHLGNSEVGKRAVTVDALVYRLVCQNGLVRLVKGKSLIHQRHIALSHARFRAALGEAVSDALVQATGFMERLIWASQTLVPDLETLLPAIGHKWALTQKTQEAIRAGLLATPRGQQETLYGLVNAITSAAQALDADDRYSLEALAGTLLDKGDGPITVKEIPRLLLPSLFPDEEERLLTTQRSWK